jgi:hypothetical protein
MWWLFLIFLIILNYLTVAFFYSSGFDYAYPDGITQTGYICSASWIDDFGFFKNGVPGFIYTPLVDCLSELSILVIIFNLFMLFVANYFLFKNSLLTIPQAILVIASESFVIYTSLYPSKELLTFLFLTLFVSKYKIIYLAPLSMMRPSYFILTLVKYANIKLLTVICFLVSIFVVPIFFNFFAFKTDYVFVNSYLDKVVDYGLTYEDISKPSFHFYKIFLYFFGYRHLLNPEGIYGWYNIMYFFWGLYLVFLIFKKINSRNKNFWLAMLILTSIFIYPLPHSRFIYSVLPVLIVLLTSKKVVL